MDMRLRAVILWLPWLACCTVWADLPAFSSGRGPAPKLDPGQRPQITLTNAGMHDVLYPVSVNNTWGYMNQQGNLVVYPRFDWAEEFYDGLGRAVVQGKTGFVNGAGGWVLKPVYPYADRFAEDRAVVGDGEHFGYIDKSGKLFIPVELDGALRFRETVAGVMKDGLCGFVNVAGNLEIPLRYTRVRSFHEGFAAVTWPVADGGSDRHGYIDRRGVVVFSDPAVTELGDFHDGMARVRGPEKWGYIDRSWKLRIAARFDDARDFTHGLAAVRVGEKWGYIDEAGRLVIPPTFDAADDLDGIMAMVTLGGKVGYVNRDASQGIKPQFESGRPFLRDYARVKVDPSFAYITSSGSPVWDPREAINGFIDKSRRERAIINQVDTVIYNRDLDPPAYREPIPAPYPPDYLYDEVLPPRKP
jgi:WG containing repeat